MVKLEKTYNFYIGNAILYIDKLIYSQIDCVYKQFLWILLSEAVFTRQYGNFETGPGDDRAWYGDILLAGSQSRLELAQVKPIPF